MQKKGTGASSGIAVGKFLLLKKVAITINETKTTNQTAVQAELKNYQQAFEAVEQNLNKLINMTKVKIGDEKAAIFEAHLEILKDPEVEKEIKNFIKTKNYRAVKAVNLAYQKFIDEFSTIEGDYFRERVADLNDVKTKLINNINGVSQQDLSQIKEEVIVVAYDLTPSETSQLNPKYVKGFICDIGGKTSHSAIMARSLGIPAVLGLKNLSTELKNEGFIALNGDTGIVEYNLSPEQLKVWKNEENHWKQSKIELQALKGKPTITTDGHKFILEANVGSVNDVADANANEAEGIGLFRTEFLYMQNNQLPSEEEQFENYKAVLEKVNHKVVIRTLDIGGDKELPYLSFPKEMNPFLGYRAIRLCLKETGIFKTQLRALLRASVYGELAIMFPMIAAVEEFMKAKALLIECKNELLKANIKVNDNIKVGMMIEIPAAAANAQQFAKYADFFSIGTNDLIQYSMAADRMSENVSYLYQPYHPGILRLIKMTIDGAKNQAKPIPVGMCGEMAGDPIAVPLLVGLGLDEFSMASSEILATKKLINNISKKEMEKLVAIALNCDTSEEVANLVKKALKKTN